jgi:hypothetical protein
MTKLTRFFATCVLVVSISAVAWADGGSTQGPNIVPPSPPVEECTTSCTNSLTSPQPSSADTLTMADMFLIWLAESIF